MSAYSANVISDEFRELKVMAVAYVSLSNQIFSIKKYPILYALFLMCMGQLHVLSLLFDCESR